MMNDEPQTQYRPRTSATWHSPSFVHRSSFRIHRLSFVVHRFLRSVAFQLQIVLLAHGRVRQGLEELDDVPDILGRELTAECRHAAAVDPGMNAPEEVDGPPAAA